MDTQRNSLLRYGATLQDGRYTIIKVLGQGGFGITYQATTKQKMTGNLGEMEVDVPVAIKEFFMKDTCLRDQTNNNVSIPSTGSNEQVDKYRQKFIKEAHNLAQLNHPNIVHVADVFEENNTVYYVMQFLKDGSLRDKLKANGRLTEEDAIRYTTQIAEALQYMHAEKHMCHYDVKPGNILLNGDKAMLICAIDGEVGEGRAGMAQIVLGEPRMVTAGLSSMMSEERMSHIFRAARVASAMEDSSLQDAISEKRKKQRTLYGYSVLVGVWAVALVAFWVAGIANWITSISNLLLVSFYAFMLYILIRDNRRQLKRLKIKENQEMKDKVDYRMAKMFSEIASRMRLNDENDDD